MKWFTRKEKPMFKEIEGFAEKVAEKAKAAEAEIKSWFDSAKTKAIDQLQFDIKHFEDSIVEAGIKLDDAFSAELASIKAKLQAELDSLQAPK